MAAHLDVAGAAVVEDGWANAQPSLSCDLHAVCMRHSIFTALQPALPALTYLKSNHLPRHLKPTCSQQGRTHRNELTATQSTHKVNLRRVHTVFSNCL